MLSKKKALKKFSSLSCSHLRGNLVQYKHLTMEYLINKQQIHGKIEEKKEEKKNTMGRAKFESLFWGITSHKSGNIKNA